MKTAIGMGGEANAVSFWVGGALARTEFDNWQSRIANIKKRELNRWLEQYGKYVTKAQAHQ